MTSSRFRPCLDAMQARKNLTDVLPTLCAPTSSSNLNHVRSLALSAVGQAFDAAHPEALLKKKFQVWEAIHLFEIFDCSSSRCAGQLQKKFNSRTVGNWRISGAGREQIHESSRYRPNSYRWRYAFPAS
jgi:hypothetical protein